MKLLETPPDQRMLDGYELVGELARGGMANVYIARRGGAGGFNRWVAVKRLDPRFACDETYATMVLDEARLAARIHHPNVSSILEIGGGPDRPAADGSASRGDYYMVMEYVEGCTLAQLVERAQQGSGARPLERRVVLRIVLDALAGLQAAHELTDDHGDSIDLVHRDCTPHNILVGANGNTRIADFGLARASARLTKTEVGTLKGKIAYMAPEQINDGPIDARTDLFTVGIVLWEALTGQRLFRCDSDLVTLERILRAPIPRLRTLIPSISQGLEEVCARALQRNPERRFGSAASMADAIEAAAAAATGPEGGVAARGEVADALQRLFGGELSERRELLRSRLSDCFAEERKERLSPVPASAGEPGVRSAGVSSDRPGVPDRPSVTTITMSYDGSNEGESLDAVDFAFDAHLAASLAAQRRSKWTRGMLAAAALIGVLTAGWAGATHLSSRFDHAASTVSNHGRQVGAGDVARPLDPALPSPSPAGDSVRTGDADAEPVGVVNTVRSSATVAPFGAHGPGASTPHTGWTARPTSHAKPPTQPVGRATPAPQGTPQPGAAASDAAAPSGAPVRAGSPDAADPGATALGAPPTGTRGDADPKAGDSGLPPNELSNPYR